MIGYALLEERDTVESLLIVIKLRLVSLKSLGLYKIELFEERKSQIVYYSST